MKYLVTKKVYGQKRILTKNLVTFKRYDAVKVEKLQYFGQSLKNPTLRRGSQKTNIEGGLA